MVRANRYLFSALVFMLACLAAACASKELPETAANPRQDQASAEDRYCLRALLVKDPQLMQQLSERLKQGEDFITLARQAAREHPGQVTDRTSCLGAEAMEPALVEAVRGLEPGQTAGPISLKQGLVLVRVTTDAHFQKGKKLLQSGRHQEAEESFKKDLALNPDHLASWHLLGISRMGRGERAGAVEAFDKGLSLAPGSPALLNDKASTLMDLKRQDEAIDSYRQALKITPNSPLLLNNLAWALAQDGKDLAQAEAMAQKAVQIAPNQPSFWDTLGQVQRLRGEHAQAVVSFHRALILGKKTEATKQLLLASLKSLDPEVVSRLTGKGGTASPAAPQPPAKITAAPIENKLDEKKPAPPVENKNTIQPPADSARPSSRSADYQDASPEVAFRALQAPEPKNTPGLSDSSRSESPVLCLEGQPVMNLPPMSASALNEQDQTGPVKGSPGETGQVASPELAAGEEEKPSREAKAQTPAEPVASPALPAPTEELPPLLAMTGLGDQPLPLVAKAEEIKEPVAAPRVLVHATPVEPGQEKPPQEAPARADAAPAQVSKQVTAKQAAKQATPASRPHIPEKQAGQTPAGPASVPSKPGEKAPPSGPGVTVSLDGYYLQPASFRHLKLAQLEMQRWVKRGYRCRLEHIDLGARGKWHRVILGPYKTRAAVLKLGKLFKKDGLITEYLVVYKKDSQ